MALSSDSYDTCGDIRTGHGEASLAEGVGRWGQETQLPVRIERDIPAQGEG